MIQAMKRFHEWLRCVRKEAGFSSQDKFADTIGVVRTQYLLYETGKSLPDPVKTVPKIAKGLGIPYEVVMTWWRLDGATPEEMAAILLELVEQPELISLIDKVIAEKKA